ncbi:helix-turn-helix transcriptional regulator [Metabacillus sp. 84]|uniref:helix-turn-helix transcriptional regulator n=1 Tax=Metabacillus sp. 84 TaxID=3404705 RepID=UPI003CFB3D4A
MHERYNEDLTLKALSSMLYISPYYFRKIFEELEGKSPSRYVLETRINAAMPLIKEGSYSIMDISRMTGFKTPSHFSRVFQRVTGAPPSYYRQKVPQ